MASIPPPRPLTTEELRVRWNAGARTLFELDPELGRWYRHNKRIQAWVKAGLRLSLDQTSLWQGAV